MPEQRIVEEASRLPAGGAVTGWASLRLHGVGYLDGRSRSGAELPVPLVVAPGTSMRTSTGTEVFREQLYPGDREVAQGVAVTSPERAAFDAAGRAADLRSAVVVLDMALASQVLNRTRFATYLMTRAGRPGVQQVRRALALAEERTMSPAETLLRLIWILDAGLPRPRCNWPVADFSGRTLGRPDLLCEELAVVGEFDGAHHRSRDRHRDDLRRDDGFRSVGLEPFRVVGADLGNRPLVLGRIRTALQRAASSTTPRTWRVKADPGPL